MRFVGDPVALVVAESRYIAEDAAELVEVDYEPLPAVVDYTTAAWNEHLVHEVHGSNVIGRDRRASCGCSRGGRSQRPPTSSSTSIHQQAYAAVPMEGRGIVVDYSPGDG